MSKNILIYSIILFFLCAQISLPQTVNGEGGNTANDLTFNIAPGEGGIGAFTGDLQFSLPLLTVPGRNGLDYTINLDYNNAIRPKQNATIVGLGFNIIVGKVTRSVVGRIDDQYSTMFSSATGFNLEGLKSTNTNPYYEGNGMFKAGNPNWDPSDLHSDKETWDTYYLNFPKGSQRIVPLYESDGYINFYTANWKPWNIDFNIDGDNVYNNYVEQFTENFRVVTDDGIQYCFDNQELLEVEGEGSGDPQKYIKFPIAC